MTNRKIVLDSWPMMAYLQRETAATAVIEILTDAHANGDSILMSVVNAGEIWYTIAKRAGDEQADNAIDLLRSLGIEFIDVDWETALIAARYKANGGISYADCFAAALAKQNKANLVTGDQEFKKLEKDLTINWVSA